MIDLPQVDLRDLGPWVDWIELCALTDASGRVSRAIVADIAHASGQVGTAPQDFFPDDETFVAPDDTSDDDAASNLAEDLWSLLTRRKDRLGHEYPFRIEADEVILLEESWHNKPSHTAMVLMSLLLRFDQSVQVASVDGFTFRQLFEKIVQACAQGLFGGSTVRFGVPREPGWPVSIEDRVRRFADEMGLRAEDLTGKVRPTDGDRTLDIASRLSLGDDGPGSVVFLGQCATGRNWKEKRGEPYLDMWHDLLVWRAKLVRMVAVPWWMGEAPGYDWWRRWFGGAVFLDRPRLLTGKPNAALQPGDVDLIVQWCEEQIASLPLLH